MGILYTPTQVHTVIYMQTSTHRHTLRDTHTRTPPKTGSKLHKAQFPKEQKCTIPSTEASIGLIQTLTVKLLLSPVPHLPPLGMKDGFFFLYSEYRFKKQTPLHLKAGYTSRDAHIGQDFIVNFLLVELEKNMI